MENKSVNKKSDSSKIILIVVILILLGVIGYLVFANQDKDSTIATQNEKISADSIEKAKVMKEYEDLQLTYQKLKEENQALGLETDSLDLKIAELNETIQKVRNSNASEIKKWKNKLATLQSEYDQMKLVLERTVAENDTLKVKLDSMRVNDARMADSLANLTAVKTELAGQVAIASVLRAENIKITAVNAKGKEFDSDEYKVKQIDKLKVAFNLGDNKVAKKNNKDIFLRVIEPSGSTLFEGDKTFIVSGRETFYTEKKSLTFDNTRQQVSFLYQKGSPFKEGVYTVEIFAEGSQIGNSTFTVK